MEKTESKAPAPSERILFEAQPLVLPTILNLENLTIIGFVIIAVIAAVAFRFGIAEIIIISAIFLLIAVPSFRSIFMVGSTTYVLTNRRVVIFTAGVGANKEKSIPLDQIQSATCKQSGLQRFYGAGEIVLRQKGRPGIVRLQGLNECKKRAEQIQAAMRKAKA